jgi:hypothetical protein
MTRSSARNCREPRGDVAALLLALRTAQYDHMVSEMLKTLCDGLQMKVRRRRRLGIYSVTRRRIRRQLIRSSLLAAELLAHIQDEQRNMFPTAAALPRDFSAFCWRATQA